MAGGAPACCEGAVQRRTETPIEVRRATSDETTRHLLYDTVFTMTHAERIGVRPDPYLRLGGMDQASLTTRATS